MLGTEESEGIPILLWLMAQAPEMPMWWIKAKEKTRDQGETNNWNHAFNPVSYMVGSDAQFKARLDFESTWRLQWAESMQEKFCST